MIKKASARNMIMGRGHRVIAETTIKSSIVQRILNVDISELEKYQELGPTTSRLAGTQGTHLHISNALTAIYLATGQDTACVAENSIGHFQIESVNDGVKFRLTLPSMTVGTVGGGTRLLAQQQNLKLLGCHEGENSSKKLAEIIMWSINTLGQLNADPETITLKRRTQQINQLDNALSILQTQSLELLKSELSPKAVLKTTNITKE